SRIQLSGPLDFGLTAAATAAPEAAGESRWFEAGAPATSTNRNGSLHLENARAIPGGNDDNDAGSDLGGVGDPPVRLLPGLGKSEDLGDIGFLGGRLYGDLVFGAVPDRTEKKSGANGANRTPRHSRRDTALPRA